MQTGILEPLPPLACYLTFSLRQNDEPRSVLRKLTGAYCWCPPMQNGRLDLSALNP